MIYKDLADRLIKGLRLESPPVAVLFSLQPPAGVPMLDESLKACEMIESARLDGRTFTTSVANHDCKGSRYFLGFDVSDEFVGTWSAGNWQAGKFPENGRRIWKSPAAHRRSIPDFSMLERGSVKYISFGPLGEVPFSNELGGMVVVVACTPKQGLYLGRMATWASGGAVYGIVGPGTCSPLLAGPMLTGEMTHTVGCFGIRQYMRVKTEEMLFGFPVEMLPVIVENLEQFLAERWDMDAILDEPVGTFHTATDQERAWQKPPTPV